MKGTGARGAEERHSRPGEPSTPETPMRIYARDKVCGFRRTGDDWGELSNFYPLTAPIAAGPWKFSSSEAVYQAAKFAGRPDLQRRIAEAPAAREAAAIGRTRGLGIDPGWNGQRVNVMRWVLRMKREANAGEIDAVLAATGDRSIVEVSTRDPWWGARPVADGYEGGNVLGRLWMELRQHLREDEPAGRSSAWLDPIRVGRLADRPGAHRATRNGA